MKWSEVSNVREGGKEGERRHGRRKWSKERSKRKRKT